MQHYKEEWDLRANQLYNPEGSVQFNCYLDHLSDTIQAQLGFKYTTNLDIDLREGKNVSGKTTITVTTVH